MAQMLSPSRISQAFPVPKCSTCGQFVPLEQLGDHICPQLSKPVTTHPSPGSVVPSASRSASPSSRPPANSSVAFRTRPSPLATSNVGLQQTNAGPSFSAMLARVPQRAPSTTARESSPRPILHLQPQPSGQSLQGRSGTPLGYRVSPGGSSISRSGTPASMVPGNVIPRDVSHSSRSASILPAKMIPPRDTGSPAPPSIAKISGTIGPRTVIPGTHHSPQQSFVPPPERGIDTKSGGEAGMAGVGRRGFAAVARAAMFSLPPKHLEGPQAHRKSNQPKFLDLDAVSRLTETPPLSAGSGYSSHSPGPTSPLPQSEFTSQPPPLDRSLSTPTQPAFFSSKSMIVRKKTADSIDSVSLYRSTTSSTTFSRPMKDVRRPISPIDSESEYGGGLAYANSTDSDSALPRSQSVGSHLSTSARRHRPSGSDPSENGNDRTGILITPRSGHSSASSHTRSNSSAIAQALGLSQTAPGDYGRIGGPGVMGGRNGLSRRNTGPSPIEEMAALEDAKTKTRNKHAPSFGSSSGHSLLYRADTMSSATSSRDLRVVIESGSGSFKAHRSNTIQSPRSTSPEKAVKLPMRASTSPKHDRDNKALDGTGARKERVRKAKVCLKCQKVIDNGRWVSVDGGGVLCERCWKNMYLPKCRRCNLSIEKQAVSSSDGQLKGKYHKECFNCYTCHKPFPDKTFYVYDGKPLCAYHYHEANDSLCAAALCGQPIEGPCAVSHSGDRYHPEHMTCEHSGYPPCQQMLSEYWEIDGRMLCEKHANSASVRGSDDSEDEEWAKSRKRITRFVELTGGIEGVGDSGLR